MASTNPEQSQSRTHIDVIPREQDPAVRAGSMRSPGTEADNSSMADRPEFRGGLRFCNGSEFLPSGPPVSQDFFFVPRAAVPFSAQARKRHCDRTDVQPCALCGRRNSGPPCPGGPPGPTEATDAAHRRFHRISTASPLRPSAGHCAFAATLRDGSRCDSGPVSMCQHAGGDGSGDQVFARIMPRRGRRTL